MARQASYDEPDVFALSRDGAGSYVAPPIWGDDEPVVPSCLARDAPPLLPSLDESDIMRHYVRLSQMTFGVDTGMYPLGSCTMKYNPKLGEVLAALSEVTDHHPLDPDHSVQGNLALMWDLSRMLCDVSGMDAITLQPAAGAQAEYLGARIIAAHHSVSGHARTEMLVPDTAHGTNPASSAMAGFHIVELPSGPDGKIDILALEAALSDSTAGLMLTNPNTLGIFESEIERISSLVHEAGGLLYYDGANLNGIMGHARPGDMGFDIVHFNFHKTFSTPHGGGGPGAGAIGVKAALEPYLPVPRIVETGGRFALSCDALRSIGKVRAYHGNFAVMVRAYAYLLANEGLLADVSLKAVRNANYLMHLLRGAYDVPYLAQTPLRKHEFVISCESIKKETGCGALDIAHRLLDYGVHAPTVHFPLIVREALMIEPTETESRDTLEQFAQALIAIKRECYEQPDMVRGAPYNTARSALDLLKATKHPNLSHRHGIST